VSDYDESLRNFQRYPLSQRAAAAVCELPDAAALSYVLSKNPGAIERLWQVENTLVI